MHEGARGRAFPRVPGKLESARRESREDARGMQGRRGEILQGHCARGRANPVLPEEPTAGAPAGVRGGIQARGEPQAARSIAATEPVIVIAEVTGALKIRPATVAHAASLLAIHRPFLESTAASFDTVAPAP